MSTPQTSLHQNFHERAYTIRRKVLTLAGAKFHVYAADGRLLFFTHMKAFKLKEDIRIYADETMKQELVSIKARQILDFGATYDVTDSPSQQKVGALRRKAIKSVIRDEWEILDATDRSIGIIQEESLLGALLRRFINWIPQRYVAQLGASPVGTYRQGWNPFVFRIFTDLTADAAGKLDRRMAIAGGILLCAIERRQG